MRKFCSGSAVALAASAFALWVPAALAAPVPFTWDFSKAVPPLGGGQFTADTIAMTSYLYALQPPGGSTPESFIFVIDGFKNGGQDVTPAGLGTAFGLYIAADAIVDPSGTFSKFDIALKADPGNHNGAASATLANGVQFANTGPTGTSDDVTLATGALVSASLGIQANGLFGAHDVQSFTPAAGEQGVFISPSGNHVQIEEFLTNTPTSRVTGTLPNGDVFTLVNGGIASADLLVPEPATMGLLGTGLLGLIAARRRRVPSA